MRDRPKVTTRVRRKLDNEGKVISTTFDRLETLAQKPSPARARSVAAGARNLETWKRQQASIAAALRIASDEFRASLTRDAGKQATAAQRVLIEGSVACFTAMQMIVTKLQKKANAFEKTLALTKEIGTLQKSLLKSVRALEEMGKVSVSAEDAASAELLQIERDIHEQRKPS